MAENKVPDVTAKEDEFELGETEGTEAGGWTWTIPVATLSICPTSACTEVCRGRN